MGIIDAVFFLRCGLGRQAAHQQAAGHEHPGRHDTLVPPKHAAVAFRYPLSEERTARDALARVEKLPRPAALCAIFTGERTAQDALARLERHSGPAALCAIFT